MILWLLWLIPVNIITVLCYLLNPIVVLFCNEEGELKGWLHYFQTHDDSVDSAFYMRGEVPKWLDYGYDKHYYDIEGVDYFGHNCMRTYSKLRKDCKWTTKEKLQRYCCRVLWLTRNCAYGFCHYIFSRDMSDVKFTVKNNNNYWGFVGNKWFKPFVYKNENQINKYLSWKIYIGWKCYPNQTSSKNCMIANRVLVKVNV